MCCEGCHAALGGPDRILRVSLRRSVTVKVAAPVGIVVGINGAAIRVDDRSRYRESHPEAHTFMYYGVKVDRFLVQLMTSEHCPMPIAPRPERD